MKKMFTLASLLIILGGLILTMTACASGWNFKSLSNEKSKETTSFITEDFNKIDISTYTADITILHSEDGTCKVVANDHEKIKYSAFVENGILKIKSADERKWYARIFNNRIPTLKVYLPKSDLESLVIYEATGDIKITDAFAFGNVNIELSTGNVDLENLTASDNITVQASTGEISVKNVFCSGDVGVKVTTGDIHLDNIDCKNLNSKRTTGDISIENINASENAFIESTSGTANISNLVLSGNLDIKATTGKTVLCGIRCMNLTSESSTGDITLTDVIAEGSFNIERTTGNVDFDSCDALEIYVETSTGNVKGSFLSDKICFASSSTGKINAPKLTTGGRCEITTSTGDIKIEIIN